jgi:hypothetical protein
VRVYANSGECLGAARTRYLRIANPGVLARCKYPIRSTPRLLPAPAFIDFKAAPQSSRAAIPARGECAWQGTPVAANEPKRLYVPLEKEMKPLVEAAQKGGIFLIRAFVQGDTINVDKIDSVNVGFVPGTNP